MARNVIPEGPLVGRSLSFCIQDVLEDRVEESRIVKIISGTFYTDRDSFHVGMKETYCRTYWKRDPLRAHALVMRLWDEGKIEQPRARGKTPPSTVDGHWITEEK